MPRRAEWGLLLGSVLATFLLIGIAEIAVRTCSNIDPLGNSAHLFIADAYGTSNGNARNAEAISYGQTVYTDEHGFRVPKGGLPGDESKPEALLILGDSIGFGPAVEEADTFAGLLRSRFPSVRIYNSSVIGYSTPDYRNVVAAFVPTHPEVTAVVLAYSLNDISSGERPADRSAFEGREAGVRSRAEAHRGAAQLLVALRRERLLAVALRAVPVPPASPAGKPAARLEGDLAAVFGRPRRGRRAVGGGRRRDRCGSEGPGDPVRGGAVSVRVPAPESDRSGDAGPPAGIGWSCSRSTAWATSTRAPTSNAGRPSTDYFLAHDAMHFSALGHRVVADLISDTLRSKKSPRARKFRAASRRRAKTIGFAQRAEGERRPAVRRSRAEIAKT